MTANFPFGGPVPPGFGPVYPPPPKRSRAGVWLGSIACVLATAALVVGVIALVTGRSERLPAPKPNVPVAPPQEIFVDDADRALCKAVGPLLREETDRTTSFVNSGDPDSAARKTAIPTFKTETLQWANRLQPLLNANENPPRYLTRTLQGYVDGMLLYSENLHEDRAPDAFDKTTYDSAVVAMGGPLATCYKLGAGW